MNRTTKSKILITLCILLSLNCYSQTGNDTKAVILNGVPVEKFLHTGISGIEIIGNLPDSVFVGVTPTQSTDVRTNLVFPEGVQKSIRKYINAYYASSFSKTGTAIQWTINALSIGTDSSSEGIISHTRLNVDIFKINSSENKQLIGNFDTLILSKDKRANFSNYISDALSGVYKKSIKLISANTNDSKQNTFNNFSIKTLDSGTLTKNASVNTTLCKICTDTVYKNGVYINFNEFLNNTPSIARFTASVDSASHKVILYNLGSATPLPSVWGVSIQNELYVYKDGQLYPIEKYGNGFYLSKYIDFTMRNNQAMFWRNRIGRFEEDDNPFNDAHIFRVPLSNDSTVHVEAIRLDMQTGELTF